MRSVSSFFFFRQIKQLINTNYGDKKEAEHNQQNSVKRDCFRSWSVESMFLALNVLVVACLSDNYFRIDDHSLFAD